MAITLQIRIDDDLASRINQYAKDNNYKTKSDTCRSLLIRGLEAPITSLDLEKMFGDLSQRLEDSLERNALEIAILRKGANKGTQASLSTLAILSQFLPEAASILEEQAHALSLPGAHLNWFSSWVPGDLYMLGLKAGGILQAGRSLPRAFAASEKDWELEDDEGQADKYREDY